MKTLTKNYFLIVFLITSSSIMAQGRVDGFYKGKGNLDLVLGGGMEINDQFYAGERLVKLARTISNVNVFAAYGIGEKLDINLSAPFVSINGNGDLQDGAIYLKYKLLEQELGNGKLSFSMAVGYAAPLSDYQTEGINAIGQQNSQIDARPIIHYFKNNGWFGTLQFGLQSKSKPTPNSIASTLKIGKASAKDYFDVWYDFQQSDGGLDYLGNPRPSTFKELGSDFHKVGATYYRPIKEKLGFVVGASSTLAGRNTGKGYGFNLGIVLKQ